MRRGNIEMNKPKGIVVGKGRPGAPSRRDASGLQNVHLDYCLRMMAKIARLLNVFMVWLKVEGDVVGQVNVG